MSANNFGPLTTGRFTYNSTVQPFPPGLFSDSWKAQGSNNWKTALAEYTICPPTNENAYFHMLLDASGSTWQKVKTGDKKRVYKHLFAQFESVVTSERTFRPNDMIYVWSFNMRVKLLWKGERKNFPETVDFIRAEYKKVLDGSNYKETRLYDAVATVMETIREKHKSHRKADFFLVPFMDGVDNKSEIFTLNGMMESINSLVGRLHTFFITVNMPPKSELFVRLKSQQNEITHINCENTEPNEIARAFNTLRECIKAFSLLAYTTQGAHGNDMHLKSVDDHEVGDRLLTHLSREMHNTSLLESLNRLRTLSPAPSEKNFGPVLRRGEGQFSSGSWWGTQGPAGASSEPSLQLRRVNSEGELGKPSGHPRSPGQPNKSATTLGKPGEAAGPSLRVTSPQVAGKDVGSIGQGIFLELQAKDLPSIRLLGKGLSSIGYETELHGVRYLRKDFVGVPNSTFRKEALKLVCLKEHTNVVKTYGLTADKMSCSLVLEYMDDGLLDLLQKRKESGGSLAGTDSGNQSELSRPLELPEAVRLMLQIARGMEFLHERGIVHGDLKTKNILVAHKDDGDKNLLSARVADFGLVRTKQKSMSFVSRRARKLDMVQWKAPEIFEALLLEDEDETSSESDSSSDEECTGSSGVTDSLLLSADVYSFAMTCFQILTGEDPYPNLNWKELGTKIVSDELRPKLPDTCPPSLRNLLVSCWGKVLARRPTFSQICMELIDISY